MKPNLIFSLLLLFIFNSIIFSQTVYFIKYKSSVPKEEIELKVSTDEFIPSGVQLQVNAELVDVNYLAKGVAKFSSRHCLCKGTPSGWSITGQ